LNATLPGTPERVSGTLPGGFFLQSFRPGAQATGTIPFTLSRTYNEGPAVYSLAAPTSGTGPVVCPDGTTGTWSVTIPSATVIMRNLTGNFLMLVLTSACGNGDISNYSGLANINPTPTTINVVLHLTGFFIAGSARATNGGAPKGAYGMQLIGEPFPSATLQVMNFDGAGGVKATLMNANSTTFTGTYTTNSDGSGSVTMTQDANPATAPVNFAFALADGGATIYVLRTSGGAGGVDVVSGVGHLQ
jgi:hypothetical protein